MSDKTVAILAPTGMLGSMVYKCLKDNYKLILVYRDEEKLKILDRTYGGVNSHKLIHLDLGDIYKDYLSESLTPKKSKLQKLLDRVGTIDALINCAVIKGKRVAENIGITFFINACLPHLLSDIYKEKLIHISTDAVFDGIKGAPYSEKSLPSPTDLYSLTKSLGDPSAHSLVFRTSFIGPEIVGSTSLLSWFLNQEGKTVEGYTNHLWNGITTKQFAIICDKVISNRAKFPKNGLFHIFSTALSKYEILMKFKEKYGINVTIKRTEVSPIDRRLTTHYDLCQKLNIPRFDVMLDQL